MNDHYIPKNEYHKRMVSQQLDLPPLALEQWSAEQRAHKRQQARALRYARMMAVKVTLHRLWQKLVSRIGKRSEAETHWLQR